MSSSTFENRIDSKTSTVRVNLPNREYRLLQACYQQAGEPEPEPKQLSHSSAFKGWVRIAVLHGEVDPSQFDVTGVEWDEKAFWPADFIFTAKENTMLEDINPKVDEIPFKTARNGELADSFREGIAEYIEGVNHE